MWLTEDTLAALAWDEDQRDRCDGCGHPRSETMSPDAEDRYAVAAFRCHACKARDHAAQKWTSSKASDPAGLFWATHREEV